MDAYSVCLPLIFVTCLNRFLVAWSVKGIYTHYIGWFSGSPEELRPLNPTQKAKVSAKSYHRGYFYQLLNGH